MMIRSLLVVFLVPCALVTAFQATDYAEVLTKSFLFYEAQRSGVLPPGGRARVETNFLKQKDCVGQWRNL